MKKQFTIFILLVSTLSIVANVTLGQTTRENIIEGNVHVWFFLKEAKLMNSYVLVNGDNNKTEIDSAGHFRLTGISQGKNKLTFQLWDSILVLDTIVHVINDIKGFNFVQLFDCEVNKYKANYDIRYGSPMLLVSGGLSPTFYQSDKKFEGKFGVTYMIYGCISPDLNCMIEYNQVVFDHLDQVYGKQWRRKVRKDVIGLKKKRS